MIAFVHPHEVGVSSRNVVSRTFRHFSQSMLTAMSSLDIELSDFHNLVCVGTKCQVSKRKRTNIFDLCYTKFEETMFLHALSVAPFQVSEIFDDVDDSYWMYSRGEAG